MASLTGGMSLLLEVNTADQQEVRWTCYPTGGVIINCFSQTNFKKNSPWCHGANVWHCIMRVSALTLSAIDIQMI